ncbi:MAG: hypothetical protein IJZ82_12300, partial [Lachnospiraceae bacterium]|nr:hypothetical protein [Lachnospiraceae bacterium]
AQYFEGTENSGASYSSEERPKNAGNYTATLIIEGGDLYKDKTITDDFTIKKAVPEITEIGASKTLYESTLVSEVVLVADSVSTPGSLTLDGVTELKLGTNEYAYKFTPDDTNNYEVVSGKVSLTVLANSLEKLEISGALNKSVYTYGEDFELAGVTVTATYADSTIKDVTSQVTYEKALVAGQTEVVLTYQGKTCKVSGIIVNKKRLDTADVNWVYEAYTYDGKEKSVTLSDNLAEGIVVTYTGNKAVDAGTYKAKAELKLAEGYSSDNYEIEIAPHISGEFEWRINPMTMDDTNTVYVLGDSLTYNGKEQTQEVKSVKCNGLQVTFNVSNNKGTNATDYVMVVTGNGNFEGSVDIPWSIAKKNISDAVVTLGEALTYNGATQTQSISSISTDGMTMTTTDYVVTGDAALNAGDYTLTVTAAENSNFTGSATAKWSIAKKDITGVEVTLGEALTYNGVEQTLDYTVGKVDGLTITYDASGYKATNAGDYEVIITANGNFTGTAKKAWSIAPKDITGAQVVLGSALTYNGSEQTQGVSSVTVDGLTLKAADYELTGNKATDAGDYTLTIKGKDNFTGTVTKGYTVAKAEAPAIADVEKYYVYSAGSSDQTVSIDLAALLPEKIGAAGYTLAENAAAYMLEETVSTDGKLTYKVAATANAGDTTTLTVTVTSKNYEDIRIKVVIKITDKFITTLMAGTEVTVKGTNELIYGQKLSDLTLDGTTAVFVADGTTDVVEGTLSWVAPDTVFTAGEATPQWKFVPKDTASYTELSGNVTITVKKAVPVVTLPAVGVSIYNPEKTLADVTLVGTKGSHTVAGSKVDVDGTWSFKDGTIVPTVKNNGYTVVFTPVDTNNYEAVEKTVAVEVAKATPVVDVKPEAAQITYGQTLADAAFTGGKAAYAEGSNIAVDGSFAWKDATMAPVVADSETTEYAVVFTPADADNYNTVTFMMTVKVAKAQNAPNMPVETLRAAHTVTTVGQISLPVDWKWAEEDADIQLETGVPETATAVYVGADAGNYLVEAVDITITRAAAPQKPAVTTPSYGTPYIQGDFSKSGWEMIRVVVTGTKIGETVNVEMNGAKVVPGDVFNDIKSKDITLVFHMESGLSWTVTGLSVTADKVNDLNLGVSSGSSTIPANVVNRVTGERYSMNISLDYSGEFGLTAILNVNVKTENEGRFANLFYYNPAYGSMQFVCADEINELGMAHLPFTHASEYVIVIDDTIMNKVFSSPKTGDGDMAWNYWWMLVLAAFAVSGGYAVNKKKRR